MWYIPAIRDELHNLTSTCTGSEPSDVETFSFDITGITVRGLGGAAKNYTCRAVQGNPILAATMNSFDLWESASADINATVDSLYQNSKNLRDLRQARNAAIVAGSPADVVRVLNGQIAVASAAYGAAVGINPTDTAAFDASLNNSFVASALLGYANYLLYNPIPSVRQCVAPGGDPFIQMVLGLDWKTPIDPFGLGLSYEYGVDHYKV
jgi:hypothetical protein